MSPARALLASLLLCQLLSYGGHQGLTIFYTLPETGQPPILISLTDNAKLDLKADDLLFANESEQHNDTKSFSIIDASSTSEKQEDEGKESTEPRLIVKATPMHETRQVEESFPSTTHAPEVESTESQTDTIIEDDITLKPETQPQEDIPSFSEWAQKQLAEAEKKDTVLNHSSQPSHSNTNFSSKSTKLRSKNYASPACGAKVIAVNPESGSASSILSPNRDEYMLNTCNSRIWFVVELCEPVQAQKIELANFELFSSTPKDIAVYFSDRFPTREWASVGQFTAQDMRDVQSFDLYPHLFGKFIRVEMLSHHGSEHYCPISLFKVYGTSEFEVLEKESSQHSALNDEDEDDEIIDIPGILTPDSEPSKNLFGSARDAVMSIVKKAAQAFKTDVTNNASSEQNDTLSEREYKRCCSPSHIIVCDNCSETLYSEVYELLSCSSDKLSNLVRQVFLKDTLKCTGICQQYGLAFKSTKTLEFAEERNAYLNALFPPKYIAALCNILAIKEKKVVLNTSYETELNVTTNITEDNSTHKINGETNSEQEVKVIPKNDPTDEENNKTELSEENYNVPDENIENKLVDFPKDENRKKDDVNDGLTTFIEDTPIIDTQEDVNINKIDNKLSDNTEKEEKETIQRDSNNGKIDIIPEKPKESINNGNDDGSDTNIVIDNDNFITEFEQMAVDPLPAGTQNSINVNQVQNTIQKESVFLRLSNRVKTLERNMSLSGQYLEELSRRYKKQVEEMQKSFEKTIVQMTEERRKSSDREQKYLDQVTNMQEQLKTMTSHIEVLLSERESWWGNVTFFKFVIFQTIIINALIYYFSKRRKPDHIVLPIPKKVKKKQERVRRRSVDGVSGHATPAVKVRRPSEEAFQITRKSTEEMAKEDGEWQVAKKNRRRKPSIIYKSMEPDETVNINHNEIRNIAENTIALDEAEYYAPVTDPVVFNEVERKELPKSNGSFFNNLKNKTLKTRRLSSPAFLRTFNRQSLRSNPSPVMSTLQPIYNGKISKKAASESPTGSLWSNSTELSQNGPHFTENGGKKKKSIKNILKKVF
ncbi:SUN domain-containing ossification factor isoform X2 [Leptidea sinapis]|uniref:SUN domain-containing ossification factor isoform X2 n=1 Tax=Leptidea sinapis TaxID=189913 RepID=UPI002124253A|nr:SUN domain-containing ossification factor isoform X2 [Leptidea sinapis]XP_050685391.1 SUN domain-containing ossification factor isoform X2 [Leptidea sinapis]XP_050685392.1 SUN domain-containing ossification factor isoform X2 [Leptidea sinapis]XP_050685393.1 SUN domain-containing ossification factor isoform X2 [Leptidea sinapis]XP_050685394.1 SUN domain-containing ossification factor isoform X2 [Leptidea sinapis]XP_050685396.1 SUN domain-containing ossification factor isoform X2 [Leptidea si